MINPPWGIPQAAKRDDCLRYWDLCESVTLDAAVALWCNVQPSELAALGFSTSCMDVKRQLIVEALAAGRLEYKSLAVPRSDGRGMWYGAGLDELIEKDGLRISKASLRRWFEQLPFDDRPAFLFDESRQAEALPDGSDVAEMNTTKALACMALILAKQGGRFSKGNDNKPNAAEIGRAVEEAARQAFGNDVRGFQSFHKKISRALALLEGENPKKGNQ